MLAFLSLGMGNYCSKELSLMYRLFAGWPLAVEYKGISPAGHVLGSKWSLKMMEEQMHAQNILKGAVYPSFLQHLQYVWVFVDSVIRF